jgi:hypothetical protein
MMVVAMKPDLTPACAPRKLFDISGCLYGSYDVSPDGKHFLMIGRDPGSMRRQLNWSDELNRLVPTGGK